MRLRPGKGEHAFDAPADVRRKNDAISKTLGERLTNPTDMAIRHSVQVTSFGGSGTTALYEHLAQLHVDVPRTPGQFPFKHQPDPPRLHEVPPGFRVVYLCGDPRDAVASVFRRGFQGGHFRGMRMREPAPEVEARLTSLLTFAEAGVDDFEIEAHLERWLAVTDYPVLFVKYDALESSWPTLRDFVGLPADAPPLPVVGRQSDWRRLPRSIRRGLDQMYGSVARRIEALPDTRTNGRSELASPPQKPITVSFLVPSTIRPIGGVIALYEFANGLCRRGQDVHLVHLPAIKGHIEALDDLSWFAFDPRIQHHVLDEFDPAALPAADFIELTALRFFTDSEFVGAIGESAGEPWGLPFVFIQAYGIFRERDDDRAFATPAPKICIAHWLTDVARSKGVPDDEIAYIPYGLQQDKYRMITPLDARRPQVSMLYGVHPRKGARFGIEALAEVRRRRPDVRVVLFANQPPEHEIPDGIDFLIAPPQAVIVDEIYNGSQVFVCSSVKEGFGFCGIESMACGCALVTTSNGGSDDYAIPDQTALVTEPKDVASMADRIVQLLDDDVRRREIATAGLEFVKRFDWDESSRLLEEFLRGYGSSQ